MPNLEHTLKSALANREAALEELDRIEGQESLIRFIEIMWDVLEPGRVFKRGRVVEVICEHLEAVTRGEIKKLLINVPPGCMKALPVETPILTTHGWTCHGDLRVGDFVFGLDGKPRRVEGHNEPRMEETFEVEFDDGTKVLAGKGHLWEVERGKKGNPRSTETVTTLELRDGSESRWQLPDAIPIPGAIDLPPQHMLIDPYILGAWLGDGDSRCGNIYAGSTDVGAFEHLGEKSLVREATGRNRQDFYRIRVEGLSKKLRVLDLIQNKRIPEHYLRGSIKQRIALLQGLMDTDGMCDKASRCIFTTKYAHLATAVAQLVASLSMKPTQQETYSVCDGERFGPYYTVAFRAPDDDFQVFRIARKQDRVRGPKNDRTRHRYVKSVTSVGERLVSCIQVEGHVYIVGDRFVPTHNSLTTNVFWPAWEWIQRPSTRYVCFSYAEHLTIRDNRKCKQLIRSEKFQRLWGDRVKLDPEEKSTGKFATMATGFKMASSVSGVSTGERGDRVIVDDPHNVKEGESEAKRTEALLWFTEALTTRVNDPSDSAFVVIMQRVHEQDISGHIIEHLRGSWDHICLPMRFEMDHPYVSRTALGFRDWRTEDGELLWPERFTPEAQDEAELTMRSEGGDYAVAGQMQQRPAPRGGGMFKRDCFQFVDAHDVPRLMKEVRGWDLAATSTIRAPYTAGCRMGVDAEGRVYITDARRKQGSPHEVERLIRLTAEEDGKHVTQDLPQDPGQSGKAQKAALARLLHGYVCRFGLESGSKEDRARPLAAQVEAGNVFLVRGTWNSAFLAEAASFPAGRFKDQVDAASRAYARLVTKKIKRKPSSPEVIG